MSPRGGGGGGGGQRQPHAMAGWPRVQGQAGSGKGGAGGERSHCTARHHGSETNRFGFKTILVLISPECPLLGPVLGDSVKRNTEPQQK